MNLNFLTMKNPYKLLKKFYKQHSHNKVVGALAGFGRAMNRLHENRNHDIHSNGEVMVLKKLANANPKCIIDAGANIGEYTIAASQLCTTNIHAFEPIESTFHILKENLKGCQTDKIVTVKKGLSSETKKQDFNIYPAHAHASAYHIKGVDYGIENKETVELIAGDEYVKENNIPFVDMLKIDVEGSEMDVLLGFKSCLENKKISLVQFEYGYINITTKVLLSDYYDFFEDLGYEVGKIYPKFVDFRKYSFKHEDFIGPNYIAIDKGKKDLKNLLKK